MTHLDVLAAAHKFWILDPLYTGVGVVLSWFYAVIPSYGLAIILLTVAVRLVSFPLTAKQARSMQAMQRVQPELKRLQTKYKADRQKLNEEVMKLYKEHNVNPVAGCLLPILLQWPLLIVLLKLIEGLTRVVVVGAMALGGTGVGAAVAGAQVQGGQISGGKVVNGHVTDATLQHAKVVLDGRELGTLADAKVDKGKIASANVVDARGAPLGRMTDIQVEGGKAVGEPRHVPKGSSLYRSLRGSHGTMQSFGMDLGQKASGVHGGAAAPFYILVALVVATGYYQQKQLTGRQPADSANAQTQMIGKVMPGIIGLVSFQFPAGVVVYFTVSNLWQIGQQAIIFNKQNEGNGAAASPAPSKRLSLGRGKTPPPEKPQAKGKASSETPQAKGKTPPPTSAAKRPPNRKQRKGK